MPIYEYQTADPEKGCPKCMNRFEVIQRLGDPPISACPRCGQSLRKLISWCRAAIVETPDEHVHVEQKIGEYERQGLWSHAAELADKHAEKAKDHGLKMRAIDNYEKAGYDARTLEKHASKNDE
jgi:putative FmdB family regulatory protein